MGIATAAVETVTAPSIGVTWDAPACIASAMSYAAWFPVLLRQPQLALTPEIIDEHWGPTH